MDVIEILQPAESKKLETLEATIKTNLKSFYDVGVALAEIRDSRLYRASHATFEAYCKDRWDMSRIHAFRMIESASVYKNLLPMGNIPQSERQARPLTSLEPEQQIEVWAKVVETAPEGKITAKHIQAVIKESKNEPPTKKTTRLPKIPKEDIFEDSFIAAFNAFYYEIQNAKMGKWQKTSKEAVLYHVGLITDLITI